jgi:RimJ/RimL family protein N-acetyltransferase
MNLISIYERPDRHALLYQLLSERDEAVNISHRAMPCWGDHVRYVESNPHEAWYFICDPDPVGACYLSKSNEIGVFVFHNHQKRGYGRAAVKALMEKHGGRRYIANINPRNDPSQFLFKNLGFKLVQNTYELVA